MVRSVGHIAGLCSAVALAAVFCIAPTAGADYIIDNFTGTGTGSLWPMTANAQNLWTLSFENEVPGVYGGQRQSSVAWNTSSPAGSGVTGNILTASGLLDYQSINNGAGGIQIVYGGNGGLNLDLTNQIGIEFDFATLSLAAGTQLSMSIGVWDGSPNERGTAAIEWNVAASGPQTVRVNFADFQGDPVNWSNIQLIVFSIGAGNGAQFQVDEVATFIPLPGAGTVMLVAAMISGTRRRR